MHLRAADSLARGKPLAPLEALRELLHDAEEGLLRFDCISPLKPFLGEGFKALSQRLEQAVFLRYGLPRWNQRDAAHKRADHLAAASEAVHVVGWSAAEVRRTLRDPHAAAEHGPAGGHLWWCGVGTMGSDARLRTFSGPA
jgi:hypothetical protein